jgi:hypothetical protein
MAFKGKAKLKQKIHKMKKSPESKSSIPNLSQIIAPKKAEKRAAAPPETTSNDIVRVYFNLLWGICNIRKLSISLSTKTDEK